MDKEKKEENMLKKYKKKIAVVMALTTIMSTATVWGAEDASADFEKVYMEAAVDAPDVAGLVCEGQMKLDYAECFDVYYYEGDYVLVNIYDSGKFLVVPKGAEVPEDLAEDIRILYQPLDRIYLQATSAMALFRALDALDTVRMTGTDANGWYIEETVEAMNNGDMLFAGKYSEPDYEMLIDEGCDLALESTMLLHTPKVQEMIEMLDIPVLIERASYETGTLGRTEWIKLYGALLDKEQEAYDFFEEQKKVIDDMADIENTGKTIAFFYLNTEGTVVVRKTDDYIVSMIEIAGGNYAMENLDQFEISGSNVSLSLEEFYAQAKEADYLVYNATIASPLGSIDELLAQSELFADFKAVQEGNVWTTGKALFQSTDIVGQLIVDFNRMLTGENQDQMTFLTKVN